VAGGRADDVVDQVVEVADLDVVLCRVEEVEVVGEEAPASETRRPICTARDSSPSCSASWL
jgi:flavin reductase (DIM6/NTAB) family NADH-FMN oxidoreductase RutF